MAGGINRRGLLVGGGAGVGLIVAWAAWPRAYRPNLAVAPGETVFGPFLKIGDDGHVTVAVPVSENGQGSFTALAQAAADELGADWRTVGVEAAPINPLYANPLALDEMFEGVFAGVPIVLRQAAAVRGATMLTGGSSSIRQFEEPMRQAGAAARALLCIAAARRWDADWLRCDTAAGFVTLGERRLRFAELAAVAATGELPDPIPRRAGGVRLAGETMPRLDVPSKVDGSANFAGDVRLPDMVFAAIRQGPIGDSRLVRVDRAAAERVPGVVAVVEHERWVAAAATNWWAANRALGALAPRFETRGDAVTSAGIDAALLAALDGPGTRIASAGDLSAAFRGARLVTAEYHAAPALHAAIETATATAEFGGGRLQLWLATDAPGLARAAAAAAAGIAENAVTVHPMLGGGSFGGSLEHEVAAQATLLAVKLGRPVQLVRSRAEDMLHDRYRPPAAARMAARLGANGAILGWQAKIAAPAAGREIARRLFGTGGAAAAALALSGGGDAYAVAGALPPYRLPAYAIDHHPAEIGVPAGHLRGGAHGYTAFFTECFLDELAHVAGTEALSYRIGMLGGDIRLARCLSTAAALGGWDGGVAGSGQGIACHRFRGSSIAVLAEAQVGEDGRPRVDRLVAAVDCGRQISPDLVRQQIEGGLVFGLGNALGASTGFTAGLADARGFGDAWLPRLADTPDITVELVGSDEAPGGVSELGVPAVAPAIANALRSATGYRLRALPLRPGT